MQDDEPHYLEAFKAFLDAEGVAYKESELPQLHKDLREFAKLLLDFYAFNQSKGRFESRGGSTKEGDCDKRDADE